MIMGFICGCLIGAVIYRGGSLVKFRWFFILATAILYLVSAGLLSKGVGFLEQYAWNQVIGGEAAEEGGDVIGYKVTTAVWHVSWGDPEKYDSAGGWQIFNAILGWNNTATIGSIVSYCLYWLLVAAALVYFFFDEKNKAIKKAEAGEWEIGDIALEQAKNYIDEQTGGIIVSEDITQSLEVAVAKPENGFDGKSTTVTEEHSVHHHRQQQTSATTTS